MACTADVLHVGAAVFVVSLDLAAVIYYSKSAVRVSSRDDGGLVVTNRAKMQSAWVAAPCQHGDSPSTGRSEDQVVLVEVGASGRLLFLGGGRGFTAVKYSRASLDFPRSERWKITKHATRLLRSSLYCLQKQGFIVYGLLERCTVASVRLLIKY